MYFILRIDKDIFLPVYSFLSRIPSLSSFFVFKCRRKSSLLNSLFLPLSLSLSLSLPLSLSLSLSPLTPFLLHLFFFFLFITFHYSLFQVISFFFAFFIYLFIFFAVVVATDSYTLIILQIYFVFSLPSFDASLLASLFTQALSSSSSSSLLILLQYILFFQLIPIIFFQQLSFYEARLVQHLSS